MMPASSDLAVARIQRDVLVAEQSLRSRAERQLAEQAQLLRQLAVRFGGREVEAALRREPTALEQWSLERWRTFFDALQPTPGWVDVEALNARLVRAEQERDTLRGQLKAAVHETARLKASAPAPTARVDDKAKPARNIPALVREPGRGAERDLRLTRGCVDLEWPVIPAQPPAEWVSDAPLSEERWPLIALQLWLIAVQGWPLFLEGRRLLTRRNPLAKSRAAKVEEDARMAGLVRVKKYDRLIPRDGGDGADTTSANVAVLTDRGRSLCRALGWGEPIKSEMELLKEARLPDIAIATGLLFAHYCRLRGYAMAARPDGREALMPDWLIESAERNERWWVVIEVDEAVPASVERWQKLAERPGGLAFCATTPSRRTRLVVAAQALGLAGRATDLQSLNMAKDPGPLWMETWG